MRICAVVVIWGLFCRLDTHSFLAEIHGLFGGYLWQIPLKLLHLRDPPNQKPRIPEYLAVQIQIPQYLAVQIQIEYLFQFKFVQRNLSLWIRWISRV